MDEGQSAGYFVRLWCEVAGCDLVRVDCGRPYWLVWRGRIVGVVPSGLSGAFLDVCCAYLAADLARECLGSPRTIGLFVRALAAGVRHPGHGRRARLVAALCTPGGRCPACIAAGVVSSLALGTPALIDALAPGRPVGVLLVRLGEAHPLGAALIWLGQHL